MTIDNTKLGPCPVCNDWIKPCKCQLQKEVDRLNSQLYHMIELRRADIELIKELKASLEYI